MLTHLIARGFIMTVGVTGKYGVWVFYHGTPLLPAGWRTSMPKTTKGNEDIMYVMRHWMEELASAAMVADERRADKALLAALKDRNDDIAESDRDRLTVLWNAGRLGYLFNDGRFLSRDPLSGIKLYGLDDLKEVKTPGDPSTTLGMAPLVFPDQCLDFTLMDGYGVDELLELGVDTVSSTTRTTVYAMYQSVLGDNTDHFFNDWADTLQGLPCKYMWLLFGERSGAKTAVMELMRKMKGGAIHTDVFVANSKIKSQFLSGNSKGATSDAARTASSLFVGVDDTGATKDARIQIHRVKEKQNTSPTAGIMLKENGEPLTDSKAAANIITCALVSAGE